MALDHDKIRKTIRELRKALKHNSQWRSPDHVHDLRTRSRRLEAGMRALTLDQEQSGNNLLKTITRIFKPAGKVRDMDVLTSFVFDLSIDGRDSGVARLLEHLHEKRQKSALKLHSRIAKHGKAIREGLKQCSSRLPGNSDSTEVQRLQSNATAFALELCNELAAWPRLTVANMHPYRLKLKELRYTLQMAEGNDSPFVTMLEEITDAIGAWHDWDTLLKITTDVLKRDTTCTLPKAIHSTASAKLRDALLLANTMRKKYLSNEAHKSHELQKTTLSESVLSAVATLASPSSSARLRASKAAAHSPQPVATRSSILENQ
jgi:CHAD domain-containing protein